MFDFKGKTVVVTGSARGIGRNIVAKFAGLRANVVMVDINAEKLEAVCRDLELIGLAVSPIYFDLSQTDKLGSLVADINKTFGSIDILVNNAKAGERTLPLSETRENLDLISDISLKAPLFLSQAVINEAIKMSDGKTYPSRCILNISSVVAQNICRESTGYHITKAAIENLTRYLAVHGGPFGFRVNAVRPGFIIQDEHRKRYECDDNLEYREISSFCHPLKRIGSSDDIANAVLFLCSDLSEFITGQILTVDGGLTIQDQWNLIHTYHQSIEE